MPAPLPVVLDTNVLLSLWAFTDSRFAPLRARLDAGAWRALSREDCLAEFQRVLDYPQFGIPPQRQAELHADYAARVRLVPPSSVDAPALPRCQDRDDQKFLEVARDGGAHWLITSDKALLRLARRDKLKGLFRILTPDAALLELDQPATA
ncbi:putative toxin-antitoxin system toxin component, PIN family [Denitratisoma sp. DHT3]|nr:putative toxin-antitoxin system toxin component, PIN family [Denitratisoma sp. DHT3]